LESWETFNILIGKGVFNLANGNTSAHHRPKEVILLHLCCYNLAAFFEVVEIWLTYIDPGSLRRMLEVEREFVGIDNTFLSQCLNQKWTTNIACIWV